MPYLESLLWNLSGWSSPRCESSVQERWGPSHIHFHMMLLFSARDLPLAFKHSCPWALPRFCDVSGFTSPLNIVVMRGGMHHPESPFLTEALISQLLDVLADEGLQLNSFSGIGPGWRDRPHPMLSSFWGSHIQWLLSGWILRPEPLVSVWDHSKELPGVHCDCIPGSLPPLPGPASFTPPQVCFQELHPINFLRQSSTSASVSQGTRSKTPLWSLIWFSYSNNFLAFLFYYCLLSLALWVYAYFFPALFSFQWYFYKAAGINTCV